MSVLRFIGWPPLRAMKYAQHFDAGSLGTHTINENEWRPLDDHLAGALDPTDTAHAGVVLQAICLPLNFRIHAQGRPWISLGDVVQLCHP